MNPKGATLSLLLGLVCSSASAASDPVERVKGMISLTEPVEGVVTFSDGTNSQSYSFGVQPRTWYVSKKGPDGKLRAAGQSYSMTWAFGGNTVKIMPVAETRVLDPFASTAGLTGPEDVAQQFLIWIFSGARFGLQGVATNGLEWDGLNFSGVTSKVYAPADRLPVSGTLILSNDIPTRIEMSRFVSPGGAQSVRVINFLSHTNGVPASYSIVADGKPLQRRVTLSELSFGLRKFPDGEGYTPSFLGETGRAHSLFYSNGVDHVIGPDGSLQAQLPTPIQIIQETDLRWWIVIGVVVLATVFAAVGWKIIGAKKP